MFEDFFLLIVEFNVGKECFLIIFRRNVVKSDGNISGTEFRIEDLVPVLVFVVLYWDGFSTIPVKHKVLVLLPIEPLEIVRISREGTWDQDGSSNSDMEKLRSLTQDGC